MKGGRKLKKLLTVIAVLILTSCGQKYNPGWYTGGQYASGCVVSEAGDNVYVGDLHGFYGYVALTNASGKLILQIVKSGGQVANQYMANASLTINGQTYCCNTQGATNVLNNYNYNTNAVATIQSLTMICRPSTYYYGGNSNLILKVGVPYGYFAYYAELLSTNRIQGTISVSTGTNISPYSGGNEAYYWVQ